MAEANRGFNKTADKVEKDLANVGKVIVDVVKNGSVADKLELAVVAPVIVPSFLGAVLLIEGFAVATGGRKRNQISQ